MTTPKSPLVEGRRTAPAGHVLLAGILFLTLATFLNAASLLRTAERQPAGTVRTVAVGIMDPLADVSGVLLLDRPRRLLDSALGRAPEASEPDDAAVSGPPATILRPEGGGSTTTSLPSGSSTTTTGLPAGDLREVTASDPMKLWVIGDSFVELFGPALQNDAAETGVIDSEVDFRFISGLTRPDYFDWPAHIAARLPEVRPDAVVVMFGGNDGQPMYLGSGTLETETPEWFEVYHQRVGEAMDVLLAGTTRVYWVGLPIMADDRFTQRVIGFNEVYQEEAAARPGVVYVDIFDLFSDENGQYSAYLYTSSGDLLDMRMPDGAHFSWNGAYRLAGFVLRTIAEEWGFADSL